jgi:cyclopropane-fatty-acyl-phospholipid synthase
LIPCSDCWATRAYPTGTVGRHPGSPKTDAWIEKYIFPNGKLPSAKELASAPEERFIIEGWPKFIPDCDHMLMIWWERFEAARPQFKNKCGQRFFRI